MPGALGRREPTDDLHIQKHPLGIESVPSVEVVMELPAWHWSHDQARNGACVGHGTAMERAIRQRYEIKYLKKQKTGYTVRFNPWWIWDRAKELDDWPDTNPGDQNGTSVRAGYDAVRPHGAPRIPNATEGDYPGPNVLKTLSGDDNSAVSVNTWATSVDQMRACLARFQPVTIGINWYSNFDSPVQYAGSNWIARSTDLGSVRGGHCVCIYGASDRHQAFRLKNSWGQSYPLVWLPYSTMDRLLSESGEATVATDSLV